MHYSQIGKDLDGEQPSEFHEQMLKDCRALVDMSRRKMSEHYDKWDQNQETFENVVHPDSDDRKAEDRKEPLKQVVPVAYAQIMTFVAFCFTLVTQRERIFELLGMSEEDHKPAKIGEAFLARDLAFNKFKSKLFQYFLDIARCSIGVFKISWSHEKQWMTKTVTKPRFSMFGLFNMGQTTEEVKEEVTKFLGNRIMNISPYRFFPDTRLPLSRFQEGEFVASEDEFSMVELKQLEHQGIVHGTKYIKGMTEKMWKDRGRSRTSENFVFDQKSPGGDGQSKGTVLVTEIQRKIVPSEYMIDGKPMGPEKYPVKYLVWYANDNRVIRCEPLNYLHDEFTYTLGEFSPDQHNLISMSLSDTIDMLQSTISWFINSHITAVRKVIQNLLVVDPNGIEMKDLNDRKPVLRLKPGAQGGIDRFIKQLDVNDVTAKHLEDVDYLIKLVQMTTGISENLMGQFHPGRRSATEARNVNSGAVARLKMQAAVIYETGLEPLARQMLSNLRDGLDEETMVRLVGLDRVIQAGPQFVKADKSALVGNYDFEVFDMSLPSEKNFIAQALKEVLMGLISNPEAAVALGMDPKAILLESMELQGVRNPERFTLKPPQLDANGQPIVAGQVNNGGAPNGLPQPSGEPLLSLLSGGGEGGEVAGEGRGELAPGTGF